MNETPTTVASALTLSGITKTYPGVTALDAVSVDIAAGRVHAVLGENGAGKSTLVGIAAGSVVPDSGTIGLAGREFDRIRPAEAREAGLAIVYQIPALAPSLSVVDAVLLLLPASKRPSRRTAAAWVAAHFEKLSLKIDPHAQVSSLSLREAHLVEIAAALASDPRVLVLDEPTEALGPEETAWLFAQVRSLLAEGVAIVYITHRIPEVMEIGNDLTVLRDGRVVGRGLVADFTADEVVELIVGRSLETTFPDKPAAPSASDAPALEVLELSGPGYDNVSFSVYPGQIIGLAGVEGNGQRRVLRGIAGDGATGGRILVNGHEIPTRSRRAAAAAGVVFLPGDRIGEAMFGKMSIRENAVAGALKAAMPGGFVRRRREYELTREGVDGLAVKTPHFEVPVSALSGGNQQKVLLARGRLGDPKVLLVEDPTQGVDAGARVDIYAFLREMAASGVAVVVLSTDAVELEGLCDRVVVFSRGRVQTTLIGDDVDERAITGAAVLSSETASVEIAVKARRSRSRSILAGETQAVVLLGLAVTLSVITSFVSSAFLSPLSISQLLAAASVLILVGLAQLVVVMTGGIDLSIGSVTALSAVVLSFFAQQGIGLFLVGLVMALAAGAVVGLINGLLVTRLSLPPVIATLVSSIAVLGVAQVLRPSPGGAARADVLTTLGLAVAGVPVILALAIVIAVAMWFVIQRTRGGRALRAAGSDPVKANRMGVRVPRTRLLASVTAGGLAALAGLAVYSRSGIGDANAAQALTLTSVTAVVIAGASIFGGSGSALAVAAAGVLLQTVTSALAFLSLGLSWQYWIQGAFVLFAAVVPLVMVLVRRGRSSRVRTG
ncbi:ATP-binding cassette domain-containing protein [Microbacterium sp. ACRRU]|uniref:ATP-binding cassette domain-containing protein n=1 Tax=Microbacterium sp. ACRRU TaxID=2918204 RepID=UPI001EF5B170|nr:ATP-binding cassette domain-containing protein [Microbacterium sp. ACRRU]MCG7416514.1 ATP-binding cassette domain-containing protein [Microbacterium sp. ACRRU]